MRVYFIIGGLGSGKSTVAKMFVEQGSAVLDLDAIGHEVLSIPSLQRKLVDEFGPSVLDENNNINRQELAEKAFAAQAATEKLTALTAPYIIEGLSSWIAARQQEGHAFVFVEASAYDGKSGAYGSIADGIIAVLAPYEDRVERACKRGFTQHDVQSRIACQPSDKQRGLWADFVLVNDGDCEHLRSQVDMLWRAIAEG